MSRLLCALLTLGLVACDAPQRGVRVTIRAAQDDTCRPERVLRVELLPLADTPLAGRPAQTLDPEAPTDVQTLEPFAADTEAVRIRAQGSMAWEGGAVALTRERDAVAVPILPLGRSCELLDQNLALFEGAAVAALPDGRFVIVGGLRSPDAPVAVREVLLAIPGEPLAELAATQLRRERAFASATPVGLRTLVVAGGTVQGAGVRDDFVVLDVDAESIEDAPLLTPRYAHAAAPLPDGSILLVGGRDASGALADGAERLILDEDGHLATAAGTAVRREAPSALALDDGSVVVVGGLDADGEPVRVIERWGGSTLARIGEWDALASAAYAALSGGRVAMVGGRRAGGDWSGRVVVLLPDDTQIVLEDALEPLTEPAAVGLPDGRVLVTGGAVGTNVRVSVVLDPGGTRAAARPIAATRAGVLPERMLRLADGAIAQLDRTGVDLLRVDLATSFDDLPAIDPGQIPQQPLVSLDAAGRWTIEAPAGAPLGPLYALASGARLELPVVRYGALRLAVTLTGPGEVLLTRARAAPVVIDVTERRIAIGDCGVDRAQAEEVVLERRGTELTLRSGAATRSCPFPDEARVGVAVRLPAGSGVMRIGAERSFE